MTRLLQLSLIGAVLVVTCTSPFTYSAQAACQTQEEQQRANEDAAAYALQCKDDVAAKFEDLKATGFCKMAKLAQARACAWANCQNNTEKIRRCLPPSEKDCFNIQCSEGGNGARQQGVGMSGDGQGRRGSRH